MNQEDNTSDHEKSKIIAKKEAKIQKNQIETEKKSSTLSEIISWIKWIVIVLVLSFLLRHYVLINADIPSTSMYPLITGDSNNPDRVVGFRLAYLFEQPKRKDIIIFKYPVDETSAPFIKRIIGLPGEKVTIKDGKIYINDAKKPLSEPYVNGTWTVENTGYTFQVPKDSYLVLGDNRNVSMDARYWALEAIKNGLATSQREAEKYSYVKKDEILGKAEFEYWPSVKWMK